MKCTVCGKRFKLKKEDRYIAKKHPVISEILTGGSEDLECFDCPRCGCQIVAGTRLDKVVRESEVECNVCQKEDD